MEGNLHSSATARFQPMLSQVNSFYLLLVLFLWRTQINIFLLMYDYIHYFLKIYKYIFICLMPDSIINL